MPAMASRSHCRGMGMSWGIRLLLVYVAYEAPLATAFGPHVGRRVKSGGLDQQSSVPPLEAATLGARAAASPVRDRKADLPPEDDTCSLLGGIRELLSGTVNDRLFHYGDETPRSPHSSWRTRIAGVLPVTVLPSPRCTKFMKEQEALGNVAVQQPPSIAKLLGPKAMTNLESSHPKLYGKLWKIWTQALSPRTALELLPAVEASVERRLKQWESFAASEEEIRMLDELIKLTLEVITTSLLGFDYATEEVMESVCTFYPKFSAGLFSPIARSLPWPLNNLPLLRFSQSMDARKELREAFRGSVNERRADLATAAQEGKAVSRTGGVLDAFLEMQAEQLSNGGPASGEMALDDDFILDNMVQFVFGGYETTSTMLARLVQVLGSSTNGAEMIEPLLQELTDVEGIPVGAKSVSSSSASQGTGIFASFPLLDAVVMETYRLNPVALGTVRRAVRDLTYDGYKIPANKLVFWGLGSLFRLSSTYPEPEKFCPFRFLHAAEDENGGTRTNAAADPAQDSTSPAQQQQPRPEMFGAGKHMCPGRELAKLEIVVFLRAFLSKFDYDLVEGQSFEPVMPLNPPKDGLRLILRRKDAE